MQIRNYHFTAQCRLINVSFRTITCIRMTIHAFSRLILDTNSLAVFGLTMRKTLIAFLVFAYISQFICAVTWNSPSNGATETLAEDRTVDSVIVTLNATASNTITYAIVSQTPSEDKFGIDNTNELYLKAELDYETISLYDVTIRALDNLASEQADITLTITVTDVNDNAPVIASDTSSDLPTNTAVGSIVFVVTATDVDTVGTVTYSITSGNVNQDFSINAMTGEITLKGALDINTTPEYDIGIEVTDGVNSVTQTITFYVNDVIWRTPKDGQTDILAENTPIDTTVITLQADNALIYSFTLLKPAAEESKFRIEGGALNLKESLDYEITKSYTFTLKALESSSLSAAITYTVNITDVNDEPPVFSSATSLDLSKDTDIGSVVYTVEVTDPDTGGSSTFLIASGNTNADFSINTTTGDLTLDKALDPHVTQAYSLVVEATDSVFTATMTLHVTVNKIAWTEPEKGTLGELPEDTAVNTVIKNLTAETATSYIIRDQIPYPDQFGIINTNELVLVSELDYENTTTHIISLRALDGSGKSADISYIVNVIDVNDLEPEFVSDTFEVIPENTPVGNTIYTASATDGDTVGTVSYSITGGNTNTSFKINTTTGDLTLDKALDPDVTLTYSLVIEATDSEFTVTMTLSIAVNKGTSLGECNYPSYCGPHCELSCQDGCVSQHCNQSCDCVKGCNSNYWGEKCKTPCSASCNKPIDDSIATCDSSNGTCLSGCNENKFWDNHCDKSCSDGCLHRKCQQESGYCTEGCDSKIVYGLFCDKQCNENCLENTCERSDGYCNFGCAAGSYGERCDKTCNRNCINGTCKRDNGYCDDHCVVGSYGEQCDLVCSGKCLNWKCDMVSGHCTDGCISGRGGAFCENVNETKAVYYYKEETAAINNTLVGVAVSGWLLLLMVLAVLTVAVIRRRYTYCKGNKATGTIHKDTEKEEVQPPISDQQEYMALQLAQGNKNEAANYDVLKPEEERTADKSNYENFANSGV